MSKLIFGCGYLGSRVARRWCNGGDEVFVVTRSPSRAEQLEAAGFHAIVADVTDSDSLTGLPAVETVLFAVGYDRRAGKAIGDVYVEGLHNVLERLPPATERLIYISSTGVYGQSDGQWVDEDSPCQPSREGGKACLAAENLLVAHPLGGRSIILRLAGIYGPGRIPLLQSLQAGEPIAADAGGRVNLIHVEDAATVILAAEAKARVPRAFCVCDGHPVRRQDFYGELASLLDVAPPCFAELDGDAAASRRGAGDKRVRNDRLRKELAPELKYPSYREGLAAIVAAS